MPRILAGGLDIVCLEYLFKLAHTKYDICRVIYSILTRNSVQYGYKNYSRNLKTLEIPL